MSATIRYVPNCTIHPKRYSGMGWTLGYRGSEWDYTVRPKLYNPSLAVQWDGIDIWDTGVVSGTIQDVLNCTIHPKRYSEMGLTLGIQR